ncbi:hypothetical protein TNCV_899511 [Trichonephila clavipes]|nr:hypothetical protein TNCV_899511 [Trichonephila clavipes]
MSIFIAICCLRQAELKTIYHATYRKAVALHLQRYHQFDGKQYHLIGKQTSGRSSLVAKVTNSWQVYEKFEPSTAEGPQCRVAMHVKPVESS